MSAGLKCGLPPVSQADLEGAVVTQDGGQLSLLTAGDGAVVPLDLDGSICKKEVRLHTDHKDQLPAFSVWPAAVRCAHE